MGKKITILLMGSRGDVQPYIPLGMGLQRAGHEVTLAAPSVFAPMIQAAGLKVYPTRINVQDELKKPEVSQLLGDKWLMFKLGKVMEIFNAIYRSVFEDFLAATEGADLIITSTVAYGAQECAEKHGIPIVGSHLSPLSPTRAFPTFFMRGGLPFGLLNRQLHYFTEWASWVTARSAINQWRKNDLGLPNLGTFNTIFGRMRAAGLPILYAYSPLVIPKPADWLPQEHVTGYWALQAPSDYAPPESLKAFLAAGAPPVYIGFGSMVDESPERLTQLAVEALQRSGQRGILLSGWGGLSAESLPDTVYMVNDISHDWLFPQVAAAVHHGGAGTTGASLQAGIPTIITPFLLDQYAWSKVVVGLGVGPKAAPIKDITAEGLADAITTAVNDTEMRRRAAALGEKIRAEDGVQNAIDVLRTVLEA